jgi:hypothetical protein
LIYFVESSEGLRIKIGTTIRLSQRIKQLRSQYGEGLKVVAVTEGSFVEEARLHARFADLRIEGEWFVAHPVIRAFIRDHADVWDGLDEAACDVSVKMDERVVKRAKIAAASRDMTLAEYLSEVVRSAAERDIAHIQPEGDEASRPIKKKGVKD